MINISKDAARRFVETWTGRGHERSESQTFWYQLLHDVFGIDIPANFVKYELPVRLKNAKFIDAYIPSTKVLIEQKSSTEDLRKAKKQLRSPYLEEELESLPYVETELFKESIEIPVFTPSLADTILVECYGAYDWSELPMEYFLDKYKAA